MPKSIVSPTASAVLPTTAALTEFIDERQHAIDDALNAARNNHNTIGEIVLEAARFLCGNLVYVNGRWYQGWLDADPYAICSELDAERAVQDAIIRKLEGVEHAERYFTPDGVRIVLLLVRPWLAWPDRLPPFPMASVTEP